MQAKSLHRNCNILVAQVDALELKRSQSEALEKEMADVLRMKDEQVSLQLLLSGKQRAKCSLLFHHSYILHRRGTRTFTGSIEAHSFQTY